jgi:hypothetical protein
MDARNGLVTFSLFIVLFVFVFVFSTDALAIPNTFYGVLALVGFIVCIGASLLTSMVAAQTGDALTVWYRVYAIIVAIFFVWFITRAGTSFGIW